MISVCAGAEESEPVLWKTVELEWEEVPGAVSYEVRLTPATGGKSRVFSVKENRLSHQVPVGNYQLQIRAKAADSDSFSAWSPSSDLEVLNKEIIPLHPEDNSVINAGEGKKQEVEFRWSPVDKVREYTLRVWSDEKKETPWIFTGTKTHKKLEVPTGRVYYWQVLFISANEVDYAQDPKTFSFSLQGAQLLRPEFIAEAKLPTWKGGDGTKAYKVKLFFRHLDETEWKTVLEEKTEKSFLTKKLKPGNYKIEVTATAPRRSDSEPAVHEFLVKPSLAELNAALTGLNP